MKFVTIAQPRQSITVFTASSLTDAFIEMAQAFSARVDVEVIFNFAGSTTLAAQIEMGADVAVFASANEEQMQNIVAMGLIDADNVHIFAENQFVLIVPADNPAQIESLQDLAMTGTLIIMASESVPIRVYTDELLHILAESYGDDYFDRVMANVVSEEPNVRQVVARIVLGEADAALVYRTDITPDVSDSLRVIALPSDVMSPVARYPIATLADAPNSDDAALFVDFVLSDEGQSILQAWGFCLPDDEEDEDGKEAEILTATPEMTAEATADSDVEVAPCA
ncbi:MAG: molybdate ABC transporter substrate-binding protein [Anaerolineae bacterium]|nr:molybdate ABC transporter substrate-binding protein [Anaerolineae bacterium]